MSVLSVLSVLSVRTASGLADESQSRMYEIPVGSMFISKHCQRHNGPEGWALITSSKTNLDQISSSESRPSINIKASTKHKPLHKNQTSKSWPNLASECRPRLIFMTSTKHQQQNTNTNSAWKSRLNFKFEILTDPCAQSLKKIKFYDQNFSFQICNKLSSTRF